MIQCLKRVAKEHSLSIIASIHQPNLETLMVFDSLYVLAKEGVIMYSGRPQDLKRHLNKCDIICEENQIPIEILMKIGFNGCSDQTVIQLCAENNEKLKECEEDFNNDMKLSRKGIPIRSKSFSFHELWYLLVRVITYTLRYNWLQICIQITLYWMTALFMVIYFDFDLEKGNSCLNRIANNCEQSLDSIKNDKLIQYNIIFIMFNSEVILFLTLPLSCLSFASNIKIFSNEYRNRESIQ